MAVSTDKGSMVTLSDGASLYVKILGDNDKSKQLLIALHGGPGVSDHREPEKSFGFLASRFRVLVYDARGSGRSDLKGPYTHDRWAADVDELRIWAGSEPVILAGGSYGGFIALEYVIKYPSHVSALILRDTWSSGPKGTMYCLKSSLTSPRVTVDPDRQYRAWTGTVKSNADFLAAFTEILPMYTAPKPREDDDSSTAEPRDALLHYETHNFAMSYNQPRFDVRQKLTDVSTPTLIVAGRHDPIAPVEFSEEMRNLMQNSQLSVFENSGHNPAIEEPDAFQERLVKFLDYLRL